MKACGLIVEYNPFHLGHQYHIETSKKKTNADCMVAVMSGPFLQRGEPAIIDKFHRAQAALRTGVDLIIELPYAYAVQSSDFFAKGAVLSLHALQVDSISFGSESGKIQPFIQRYTKVKDERDNFKRVLHQSLEAGKPYPSAYNEALTAIGMESEVEHKPNNILGMSYVQTVLDYQLPIELNTIKRIKNQYHDAEITQSIASATSIREHIQQYGLSAKVQNTIPSASMEQLSNYHTIAKQWHHWELYFPLLKYKILSSTPNELARLQGVDEGIEHRLKEKIYDAHSFATFVQLVKTKRYTLPRIQRMCTHILTNTTKADLQFIHKDDHLPYIRVLGFNDKGKQYLNKIKHDITLPMYMSLNRKNAHDLFIDERASDLYYACLDANASASLRKQEFQPPLA